MVGYLWENGSILIDNKLGESQFPTTAHWDTSIFSAFFPFQAHPAFRFTHWQNISHALDMFWDFLWTVFGTCWSSSQNSSKDVSHLFTGAPVPAATPATLKKR